MAEPQHFQQKLSFNEKTGYSAADAAANFVFMTMILFRIMAGLFNYDTKLPDAAQALQAYRVCSGIAVGVLFGVCTLLLIAYQLNKKLTIQMADELAARRSVSVGTPATAN